VAAFLPVWPTIRFWKVKDQIDIYALAASVASLTAQVDNLTKCLDSAATHRDLENLSKRLESSENFHR